MKRSRYLLIAALLGAGGTTPLMAKKNVQSSGSAEIAVIVNKDAISQKDIDDRIKLLTFTSGGDVSPDVMTGMRRQVVKSLIDELLQTQAAKAKKIDSKEEDVKKTLEGIAKENGMTLDQMKKMFASKGVNIETLARRVRVQITWAKYIRETFGHFVHVGDSEIDKTLQDFDKDKDRDQYAVLEIVLRVDNPSQEASVRADAKKILSQLKSGANFMVLARQFSQAPSAANGGDIGWITKDYMDASLKEVIQKMKPGDISDIIRTSSGFHIIHLREVKRAGEADPGETEVTFCQAVFPLKPDSMPEEMAVVGPQIEETLSIQGCSSLVQTAKKYGVRVETSKPMKWRSLPDGLKMLMKNTPIGKCTQPAMTPDGVVVTMLCSKKIAELKPPTREEISAMLEQEKFAKKAERELTQLRTTAFIDVKDSSLSLDDLQSKKSQ